MKPLAMLPLPPRTLLVLPALALGACATIAPGRTAPVDPFTAEANGALVFTQFGLPVAEHAADGRVTTGPFRVDKVWGGPAGRVQCDMTGAENQPIELSVTLRVSHRRGWSFLSLESSGRTIPATDEAQSRRCRLTDTFTEELLAAVAGDLSDGPALLPPVGVPGGPRSETVRTH